MKVLKFGGTSVGSIKSMINVKNIINDGNKKIVVLSAMSGTTNELVAITNYIKDKNPNEAIDKINKLHETYSLTIDALLYPFHFKEVLRYVSGKHYIQYPKSYLDYLKVRQDELLKEGINIDLGE